MSIETNHLIFVVNKFYDLKDVLDHNNHRRLLEMMSFCDISKEFWFDFFCTINRFPILCCQSIVGRFLFDPFACTTQSENSNQQRQ
jgi:hypothetical protein